MSSKPRFAGTGSVYSFTLRQMLKSKANIISFLILLLISVLAFPLSSMTNAAGASDIRICNVYIYNNSGYILDYSQIEEQYPELSKVVFEERYDLNSYWESITDKDVFVVIGKPSLTGSCSLEAHTLDNSALSSYSQEMVLTALSAQLDKARYEKLGFTPEELSAILTGYSVDSYSSEDYADRSDTLGFDGSFLIQYIYSILVLILCVMSSGFIIRAVIEEKASKLIELLMVSVQPLALLIGKILAVMTYVIALLLSMAAGFLLSYTISSRFMNISSVTEILSGLGVNISLLNIGWETVLIVLISLALAFGTYAILAGLVGTCCSTVEDIEPANGTVVIIIMAGYLVSCMASAISGPGPLAILVSLCPVVSTFCAPVMYVCANISLPVLILSWVIQGAILALLAIFNAKIYRDLLLYRGSRLKLTRLFAMLKNNKKEEASL